jgi:hypothetical protein
MQRSDEESPGLLLLADGKFSPANDEDAPSCIYRMFTGGFAYNFASWALVASTISCIQVLPILFYRDVTPRVQCTI